MNRFTMIWHLIKYWITFFLPAFYKRIQGKNIDRLLIKGPAIIAMNHPNAFTDPILFSYLVYPARTQYLARGDAFKPGLIAWLLERIGIVPIYRIQDGGKEGLKKNDEAYRRVNALLKKNSKIMVFAEGLCVQERRLRPLKKGVARMIFGAYEALNNDRLVVYPVGVNYNAPDKFRSNVFYNIGEPIFVKDFISLRSENPAKAHNAFLQVLSSKMKDLITHIDDKRYDEVVYQVESLCKKDWLKNQGLNDKNLEHDFIVTKQITEKVNNAVTKKIEVVDDFKLKATDYFEELNHHQLNDYVIRQQQTKPITFFHLLLRYILLVAELPLYVIGLLGNFVPLVLTHKLTKKIAKTKEFYSSFAIGFAMVIFSINYVLWFCISYVFSPSVFWPILICLVLIFCGCFCVFYYPFKSNTIDLTRVFKNKGLTNQFLEKRKVLLDLINKF
jgi:glycerol-3-phosphate O-acyltransferase / dihydroxyacetone phosphate acyltransferase